MALSPIHLNNYESILDKKSPEVKEKNNKPGRRKKSAAGNRTDSFSPAMP